ncbi:hypothetical protein RB195_003088 [Necator americanus]|uniref:Uncharacterized protein n=1 Tax=Necator americanus TaxID=51031 RepID=A0ABR1DMC7_NECAM
MDVLDGGSERGPEDFSVDRHFGQDVRFRWLWNTDERIGSAQALREDREVRIGRIDRDVFQEGIERGLAHTRNLHSELYICPQRPQHRGFPDTLLPMDKVLSVGEAWGCAYAFDINSEDY